VVVVVVELRKQVVRVRPQLDVLDRIGGWGGGENRVRKTAVEELRVRRRGSNAAGDGDRFCMRE
jgi:hypothetical protein